MNGIYDIPCEPIESRHAASLGSGDRTYGVSVRLFQQSAMNVMGRGIVPNARGPRCLARTGSARSWQCWDNNVVANSREGTPGRAQVAPMTKHETKPAPESRFHAVPTRSSCGMPWTEYIVGWARPAPHVMRGEKQPTALICPPGRPSDQRWRAGRLMCALDTDSRRHRWRCSRPRPPRLIVNYRAVLGLDKPCPAHQPGYAGNVVEVVGLAIEAC